MLRNADIGGLPLKILQRRNSRHREVKKKKISSSPRVSKLVGPCRPAMRSVESTRILFPWDYTRVYLLIGFSSLVCSWPILFVWLFATPWTVARLAPLSMGFLRQEYWSELPFSSPGDLPNPGIEPGSPAWQADSLPLCHLESTLISLIALKSEAVG